MTHPVRTLSTGRYADPPNLRVQLWEDGAPYATLSTNIEGVVVDDQCFIAKEYSENAGLCDPFLEDGTFEDTGQTVSSGFVTYRILRIVPECLHGELDPHLDPSCPADTYQPFSQSQYEEPN